MEWLMFFDKVSQGKMISRYSLSLKKKKKKKKNENDKFNHLLFMVCYTSIFNEPPSRLKFFKSQ